MQVNHEEISSYITPYNRILQNLALTHHLDTATLAGRSALDGMVTLQATIISYADDFKLMMLLSLGALPLLLLLKKAPSSSVPDHTIAME
jgi:DHA2 family multidrug resistance protein